MFLVIIHCGSDICITWQKQANSGKEEEIPEKQREKKDLERRIGGERILQTMRRGLI